MNTFDNLLKVCEERKHLEALYDEKKIEFQKETQSIKDQLDKVSFEEEQLRSEVLEKLNKNNEDSIEYEGKLITRNIRKTFKINNPQALREQLNELDLEHDFAVSKDVVNEWFEDVVLVNNKKDILNLVDTYKKIEGQLLNGVVEQQTEFITIKENLCS